jgi:A/G-specific adenine glycosylase
VKQKKLVVKTRHLIYIYLRHNGQTAIRRRGEGDIWQGLWEPLLVENGPLPQLDGELSLRQQGVRHVLTHRVLMADFYVANLNSRPTLPDDYIWIDEKELDRYALPRLVELLVQNYL